MLEFFRRLFSADFMPHGMCFFWNPPVLWLNVLSDSLIAACYYAIPFYLVYLVRKRRNLAFKGIFLAFAVFILACGATHVLGAVTIWNPVYRLEGVLKAVTALASVTTLLMLIPAMPALVRIPTSSQLAEINRALAKEIHERRAAEAAVRTTNTELEERVETRTAELAHSDSLFRQLIDAIPQLVWVAGADGSVEYMNSQWFRYTGATMEQSAGTGWQAAIHPDDRITTLEHWSSSMQTDEMQEVECRLRAKDGAYRWFLARGCPLFGPNKEIVKWFGTFTNIDDHRRAKEALTRAVEELKTEMDRRKVIEAQLVQSQKMDAMGRLAGGVAHDFNNLLTVILGFNEMLRQEIKDASVAEYADEVLRAAQRASSLTNQLLAFSRRQVTIPRVLDINELVQNIEKMLRRIIGEDIELEIHVQQDVHPVKVDSAQIDQVIMNLAVNARDAMPNGGKLLIETANVEFSAEYAGRHLDAQPGPHVMLAVSDTGQGMDASTRAHLFEPFFTTKEKGKGTGLGLSIVYGIVKQNNGEIQVYSEPGQGAVFKIYLPAVLTPAEVRPAPPVAIDSTQPTETILLVEDEEQVRMLTRTMLMRRGYTVLESASGRGALELAKEHEGSIELLLTDIVMPQMNGVELAREMQTVRPGIQVLFMSGYTENGVVNQGVLNDARRFIQKPFTSADLARKVREALRTA
jgi:PAS domain S-box-containing protein